MSILGVSDVLGAYQYANRTQKAGTSGTSFTEQLQKTGEAAEKRRQEMEIAYRKQTMEEALANRTMETNRFTYTATSEVMSSVATAYEKNIMGATGILQ